MLEVVDRGTDQEFFHRLEVTEPGPELAEMLASVDRSQLNGYHLVTVMAAWARQRAHDDAEFYATMAEIAYCPPGGDDSPVLRVEELNVDEFASAEIAAALRLTRRGADNQLGVALDLTDRHPQLLEALRDGNIDLYRARRIINTTEHLSDDDARTVTDRVLDEAGEWTAGQLQARLRKILLTDFAEAEKERYEHGLRYRAVKAYPNPDGTANLVASSLPADQVAAMMKRLTSLANDAKTPDDARDVDQRRADVFTDLLLNNQSGTGSDRAIVDIRVDLKTLIELSDTPGEIPGWGAVIADIARQVAAENHDGEWRWAATHPDDGAILTNGTTRRRPTNKQRRWVEARRPTCVFPGCRMPAQQSDIDHTTSRTDNGHTVVRNLAPACRFHHRLKHETPWKLHKVGDTYVWTSPLGHTYTTNGQSP